MGRDVFVAGLVRSFARNALTGLALLAAFAAPVAAATYGNCEVCGKPIGAARLEAKPAARLCIADAAKH